MGYIEIQGNKYNFDKAFGERVNHNITKNEETGELSTNPELVNNGEYNFTMALDDGPSVLLIELAPGYEHYTEEDVRAAFKVSDPPKGISYAAMPKKDFEKWLVK